MEKLGQGIENTRFLKKNFYNGCIYKYIKFFIDFYCIRATMDSIKRGAFYNFRKIGGLRLWGFMLKWIWLVIARLER